jgi:hypothetical protein
MEDHSVDSKWVLRRDKYQTCEFWTATKTNLLIIKWLKFHSFYGLKEYSGTFQKARIYRQSLMLHFEMIHYIVEVLDNILIWQHFNQSRKLTNGINGQVNTDSNLS